MENQITYIHQIIGENVRFHRNSLGWSQVKLAKECGLNNDYIGRLEQGLENIGIDNLAKIALLFSIEPYSLLSR